MNNPYEGIPGPEWDPTSDMYLRDPGSVASSLLLDIGVAPTDGATYRGMRPPAIPEGQKGYWVMTGTNPGPNQQGRDGVPEPYLQQTHGTDYRFVAEQAAKPAQQPLQQQEAPLPKYPDGNIYEDNEYWQNKARAEVEGINKMPGVFSNYADISLMNPKQIENIFYPPSWQAEGVQKNIGPNGTNIGPQLETMFGDSQAINTKGQSDFPTLIEMLTNSGQVDTKQRQTLLDMLKPKKLDTSFGGGGMGMGGMGGGMSMLGNMVRGS